MGATFKKEVNMSQYASFELKEFNAASLTGAYQNFGTALSDPCYEMIIFNTSDVDVYVSKDGTNDTWRIPSGSNLPVRPSNKIDSLNRSSFILKVGDQLEIKQVTAAGTGNIIANLNMVDL